MKYAVRDINDRQIYGEFDNIEDAEQFLADDMGEHNMEIIEMSLTIEYKHKNSGLHYIRFNADGNSEDSKISLYCCDDDTGAHDVTITVEMLQDYEVIDERMEEN